MDKIKLSRLRSRAKLISHFDPPYIPSSKLDYIQGNFYILKNILYNFFLIALSLFSLNLFAQDTCLNWFQASGVKSNNKDCLLRCALIPKNMSTFYCANRCREYCKIKKCNPDFYWKNKLKNGAPKNWNIPTEQPANWTDQEISQIMKILNLMPNQLKELSLDGIFRMKKSYLKTLGWKQSSESEDFRSGDFVSLRAKDNFYEDFAENFSFFLLSRNILKSKVPKAYDWLVKKITTDLKLKEECKNGKN